MMIAESVRFALTGVRANKMRPILTTLGILIGIASVIILLAVGAGTSNAIKAQIGKLGTNVLTVSRQTTAGGRAAGGGQAVTGPRSRGTNLTLQDMAALTDPVMAPDVAATAPVVTAQNVTGTYQDATHAVATFVGTTPSYFSISNDTLAAGSYFSDGDASSGTAVAVI